MSVIYLVVDLLVMLIVIFLLFKFWFLKIPEVKLAFEYCTRKSRALLANEKVTKDKELQDLTKDVEANISSVVMPKKVRKAHTRAANNYLKEDL